MRLQPNEQFAGYRVLRPLGRGGMAFVYLAEESGGIRQVALKLLPEDLLGDAPAEARFQQEARTIMALEHPNIVPLYRHGIERGAPWMALRYVEGGDLAERLGRSLAMAEGVQLFRQIAKALDFAHRRGVVHRDLKPQNVLLSQDGHVYLADFGIAKMLSGVPGVRTGTGGILGTPQYMAPEYARGEVPGPAADLYALGVMAFQWLTGTLPFDADTPQAVLFKQALEPLPEAPLRGQPASVRALLLTALDKDPLRRPPTASDFVDALAAALEGPAPVSVGPARALAPDLPVAPTTPLPPPARASRGAAASRVGLFAVAVAAAAVVSAALLWRDGAESSPGTDPPPATTPSRVPPAPAARSMTRPAAPADPADSTTPEPRPSAPIGGPSSQESPPAASSRQAGAEPAVTEAAPRPGAGARWEQESDLPASDAGASVTADVAKPASNPGDVRSERRVDVSYRQTRPARYPPDALRRGVQGTVMVLVLVGPRGTVSEAKVHTGVDPSLDEAALQAVRGWRFFPATVDGVPQTDWALVPVRFSLDG